MTFATATARAAGASAVTLTLKPSSAAARGLKGGRKEKVTITIAFLPVGGTAASQTTSVTVAKKRK